MAAVPGTTTRLVAVDGSEPVLIGAVRVERRVVIRGAGTADAEPIDFATGGGDDAGVLYLERITLAEVLSGALVTQVGTGVVEQQLRLTGERIWVLDERLQVRTLVSREFNTGRWFRSLVAITRLRLGGTHRAQPRLSRADRRASRHIGLCQRPSSHSLRVGERVRVRIGFFGARGLDGCLAVPGYRGFLGQPSRPDPETTEPTTLRRHGAPPALTEPYTSG